jgi:hypothetical protein
VLRPKLGVSDVLRVGLGLAISGFFVWLLVEKLNPPSLRLTSGGLCSMDTRWNWIVERGLSAPRNPLAAYDPPRFTPGESQFSLLRAPLWIRGE